MHKKLNLFKNPVLKVVSLLLAILLWVLVSNINDPVIYRQFSNIPVEIRNANRITEQGQVYRVLDETDIVDTVTIGAQRTKAEQLTADNIIAVADVDELTQLGTVPIRFSTNLYSGDLESIKGNIDYVRLDIENRKSTVFALQTTTSGALAEGYTLSDITTEQNQIRVTGPESIVSSISKAVANVDVSGARNTIVTYADIRLYDQNDRQISKEGLTMNITNVRVTVNILSAKTLPLTFSTTGAPADGYLRSGTITANPSEILVKGRSSVLNSIDRIDIPAEVLDVTGRTSDLVQEVDITPYLPDNVSFAQDDFEGLTEVRVGIVQAHARSIEIPIGAIRLDDIPAGYSASIIAGEDATVVESVAVRILGLQEVVENVTVDFLTPRISVGSLIPQADDKSGVYLGTVQLTLPTQVVLQQPARVHIHVVPEAAQQEGVQENP